MMILPCGRMFEPTRHSRISNPQVSRTASSAYLWGGDHVPDDFRRTNLDETPVSDHYYLRTGSLVWLLLTKCTLRQNSHLRIQAPAPQGITARTAETLNPQPATLNP